MISVLVLTLNEEANLPRCMQSLGWCDDVVVFDSYSTDRTLEIARAAGARVVQRKFDNERDHRTASLSVSFKYPWVYNPDADEVTTGELRDEMIRTVGDPSLQEVAYRVRFKTMFMDRWIKRSSMYPTWVVRLFKPEKVAFRRSVNLDYVIDGPVGRLESHFLHYTFNKGLDNWFEKHNLYSRFEALDNLDALRKGNVQCGTILSSNVVERRKALKELSYRLPFRPTLRFLYMYLLRRGFLDGRPGFTYCRLLAIYEYMIVLKIQEQCRREKGLSI